MRIEEKVLIFKAEKRMLVKYLGAFKSGGNFTVFLHKEKSQQTTFDGNLFKTVMKEFKGSEVRLPPHLPIPALQIHTYPIPDLQYIKKQVN